ncbi:MAG: fasciclin domain-containing protein [Bacteroidota bacterium]
MSRLLLVAALAVALSACGSEENADPPASIADTAEAIEAMPPAGTDSAVSGPSAPPALSGATIVDRVAEAGDLTTLSRLLRESDVADDLAAEGPFTLFAPSNEAFAAAGDLPADAEAVRSLLLGHALSFRMTAVDMDIEQSVQSVGGSSISVVPGSPPAVSSGGSRAMLVRTDLDAANGVVHIIDSVLR